MKEWPTSGMTLQISLLCYGVLQTDKKEEFESQYTNRDALIPCIKLGVVCWVWTILSKASCGFLAVKIFCMTMAMHFIAQPHFEAKNIRFLG
jgi:hypothetical protein